MSVANLIAFICYLVAAPVSTGFIFVYLARSTFMLYHRDALSTSWEKLDWPLQARLRSFNGLVRALVAQPEKPIKPTWNKAKGGADTINGDESWRSE